jgi:hypothetical protein
MSEQDDKIEFAEQILNQDVPEPIKQSQQNSDILKKVKQRMKHQKFYSIAIFFIVIFAAFVPFMMRVYVKNPIHAISWGTVSLHILLWFMIYCLSNISIQLNDILDKTHSVNNAKPTKSPDWLMVIIVSAIFAFSTFLLGQCFFLSDPVKVAKNGPGVLFGAISLLIFYISKIAALLSKLWFEHKKLELKLSDI